MRTVEIRTHRPLEAEIRGERGAGVDMLRAVAAADHLQRDTARGRKIAKQAPPRTCRNRVAMRMGDGGHTPRAANPSHHERKSRPFGRDMRSFSLAQIFAKCR